MNYLTGEGMERLNCNAGNAPQVPRDAAQITVSGAQWVRIETSMSAITGLSKPPLCRRPVHEFDRLTTLLSGIRTTGAQPLLNILGWHYPPSMRHKYLAWLSRLLAAAPDVTAFEIGDEPNLSVWEISWPGVNPDEEPYGWDFNPAWFSPYDGVGLCPSDPEQLAAFGRSVAQFVTWIADNYQLIKAQRPAATVLIGGISSWRPGCWLRELGRLSAFDHADGIAYHAYPRYDEIPEDGASTLNDLLGAMRSWPKPLPVWVTEYGFSTRQGDTFVVKDEVTKAAFLETEFNLLAPRVQGPIFYYKLRDWPLTSRQWLEVCHGVCPGGIGGFGLLEWRNGALIKFPAYRTLVRLRGGLAAAPEGTAPPAP